MRTRLRHVVTQIVHISNNTLYLRYHLYVVCFMKSILVVLVGILLFFEPVSLTADNHPVKIQHVPISPIPSFQNVPVDWFYDLSTTYDPNRNVFYVSSDTVIYTIDFNQGQWSEYTSLQLPDNVRQMEYSAYHDGILFWDRGVGRVFLLDSLKNVTRLDRSFEHRNQFGHSPWVNPETGSIYAFGGYGLFTSKSIITQFSPASAEWDLVSVSNAANGPAPQTLGFVYPDFTRDQIYLFGNKTFKHELSSSNDPIPDQKAIWRFDLPDRIWERLVVLEHNVRVAQIEYRWLSLTYPSVHPVHPIFLFPLNDQVGGSELHVYHDNYRDILNLTQVNPAFRMGLPVLNIVWSEVDQVYYVITCQVLSTANELRLQVHAVSINDIEALEARFAQNGGDLPWLPAILLVLLLIPGAFWMRKRRIGHEKSVLEGDEKPFNGIVVERLSTGGFKLSCNGFETSDIPAMEVKLLDLLVNELKNTGSYVKSDDIDAVLLPDHPSPDYIRRTRNLTLERLEALLQSVCELENDQKYILRRSNVSDKRKNEYRLNSDVIRF